MSAAFTFHEVEVSGLAMGGAVRFEIGGTAVALFKLDSQFFAISDLCTHARGRLSSGFLEAGVVECPLHFGKFDVRTGKALSPPCKIDVQVFPVRREGARVLVGLPHTEAL